MSSLMSVYAWGEKISSVDVSFEPLSRTFCSHHCHVKAVQLKNRLCEDGLFCCHVYKHTHTHTLQIPRLGKQRAMTNPWSSAAETLTWIHTHKHTDFLCRSHRQCVEVTGSHSSHVCQLCVLFFFFCSRVWEPQHSSGRPSERDAHTVSLEPQRKWAVWVLFGDNLPEIKWVLYWRTCRIQMIYFRWEGFSVGCK